MKHTIIRRGYFVQYEGIGPLFSYIVSYYVYHVKRIIEEGISKVKREMDDNNKDAITSTASPIFFIFLRILR